MCYSRTQLARAPLVLALIASAALATGAGAQGQGGYRVRLTDQRTVGWVDLGSQLFWLGASCDRSVPIDSIRVNGGTTTIEVTDQSTSPELPTIEERVTLEITANQGQITIDADYLPQPLVLALHIQRLGRPPCR